MAKTPNSKPKPQLLDITKEEEIILISKLSDLEKFCLDAYIVSDASDKDITAYKLSRPKQSEAKDNSLYNLAWRWLNSDKVIAYIKAKRERIIMFNDKGKEESENVMRSKEDLIVLVNKFISKAEKDDDAKTVDSLVKNLTALQQLNKEQNTEESEQIKYYLPLKCSQCQLYKSAKLTNISTK